MTQTDYRDEVVWIIGASSGIGAALARECSARGARLALSARRKDALDQLKDTLAGDHKIFPLDVAHADDVLRTAQAIRAVFGRLDRVIYLAAVYTPMQICVLDLAVTRQIVEVNLLGVFHALHAVLPLFKEQQKGQIALCGSVAGYIGLPGGQPYSATKAGVMNIAESLVAELPDYIDVKLISPGFVRTELSDKNSFDMPMIIGADQAARSIADGLRDSGFEVHFPKRFTIWLKILRLLPYSLAFRITKALKR